MRPELCVGAVVVHEGHLLLVQRGRPPGVDLWSVPGGRVEPGETMAAAVVREIHEETGLRVEVGPLIGWVERISPEHHFVIFDFAATVIGETLLVAGDDAAAADWVALETLHTYELVPGLAEFLRDHTIAR